MKIKKRLLIIVIVFLLVFIYELTYIPLKIININPKYISKIDIFNGNTGKGIEITNRIDIEHIINNFNNVKFKKDKLAIGYLGYNFRITIYDRKGKIIKELIINSNDRIRYKGFFYSANENIIDYNYIEKLFELEIEYDK